MVEEAIRTFHRLGSKTLAAEALGMPRTTLTDWVKRAADLQGGREIISSPVKGRREVEFTDGIILIGSDAHYWPGPPSTAHRAFLFFIQRLKPSIVIMNGDAIDGASISRHPAIGWESCPTVKQELDICQERLGEIERAADEAQLFWSLGNHDARFETKLATVAPEFREVHGVHLQDHFPAWAPCWSVFIGGEKGVVVKHRFKGGMHAPHNNALWSGRSSVTGHLHSLKVQPISDYNGTRFGVDGGCLADPHGPQFAYSEDNARSHRSGFIVLTFKDGRLLWPEPVHVLEPGIVEFRGEIFQV